MRRRLATASAVLRAQPPPHHCERRALCRFDLLRQTQFRGLSVGRVRLFCAQLLDALVALEEADVVHCDLKPENVLLENNTSLAKAGLVKVIDFGSAAVVGQPTHLYIQSRFYRAPEVLLGAQFSRGIDMWSFGCLAAELCLGIPLFPGRSAWDQIRQITEVLGPLPHELLQAGRKTHLYFHKAPASGGQPAESRSARPPATRPEETVNSCPHGDDRMAEATFTLRPCDDVRQEQASSTAGPKDVQTKPSSPPSSSERAADESKGRGTEDQAVPSHSSGVPAPAGVPAATMPTRQRFKLRRLSDIAAVASQWDPASSAQWDCFADFLGGLLQLNPARRWSPREAAAHPFITREPFVGPYEPPRSPLGVGGGPPRGRAGGLRTRSFDAGAPGSAASAAQASSIGARGASPHRGPVHFYRQLSREDFERGRHRSGSLDSALVTPPESVASSLARSRAAQPVRDGEAVRGGTSSGGSGNRFGRRSSDSVVHQQGRGTPPGGRNSRNLSEPQSPSFRGLQRAVYSASPPRLQSTRSPVSLPGALAATSRIRISAITVWRAALHNPSCTRSSVPPPVTAPAHQRCTRSLPSS